MLVSCAPLVWRGYWIDEGYVMSEWIKCEEQLPQQNEEVLIFGESWGMVVAFINHHGIGMTVILCRHQRHHPLDATTRTTCRLTITKLITQWA